jgi:hypothetical protein
VVGDIGRDAGGSDGFAGVDALGRFEVEVEELLEEVAFGGEAVGGRGWWRRGRRWRLCAGVTGDLDCRMRTVC